MSYNQISKGYNELYGEEQLNKARIIARNLKLKKSARILDVGCGTGIGTSLLNCRRVGIDPSEKLLKQAGFEVIKGAAEKLPFKDKEFDAVISVTAVHNFKNIKKGLEEMKRVSKNSLVISVLKKSRKSSYICRLIRKEFKVIKEADEGKDLIFFLEKA